MTDKKVIVITITKAFQKIFDASGCKPNQIWVDKGSDFYNRSRKSWSQDHNIKIYSTHNEVKPEISLIGC